MSRLSTWLMTTPGEDDMFFTRIRETAQVFFIFMHDAKKMGHSWEYSRGNTVRRCPKCGWEQWEYSKVITRKGWKTMHPQADLP